MDARPAAHRPRHDAIGAPVGAKPSVKHIGHAADCFNLRVEVRLHSVRANLFDGSAPKLIAVIAEASLMYRWGSRNERREQILHLVELSRRSNVELHIQRFADGPYRGMWSMVNIFDFADDEPSLVYLETDIAIQEASKPEEVDNYVQGFGHARDAALEPGDTAAYLKHLAEQLE